MYGKEQNSHIIKAIFSCDIESLDIILKIYFIKLTDGNSNLDAHIIYCLSSRHAKYNYIHF